MQQSDGDAEAAVAGHLLPTAVYAADDLKSLCGDSRIGWLTVCGGCNVSDTASRHGTSSS